MNSRITKISILGILLLLGVFSCKKDDLTQAGLLTSQSSGQLKSLKALSASDSLNYLLSLSAMKYQRYKDSLRRVDSLAAVAGKASYLPYTYEVQVLDGSASSISLNGRAGAAGGSGGVKAKTFGVPVTVTITQYGVKQTQTGTDGLFTFKNIGVGAINGSITAAGYAEFDWVTDASLPYQLFPACVQAIQGVAGGSSTNGTGGAASATVTYFQNSYILSNLLAYFNNRSFSNAFPIFATAGPSTSTVMGRAYIETDLTNRTKEVAVGATVTASIDVNCQYFKNNFIQSTSHDPAPTQTVPTLTSASLLNSIFPPKSFAIGFLGTAVTNATGDYTITIPGANPTAFNPGATNNGGLPILFQYSDIVADKTYFTPFNGDVTTVTARNVYGPSASANYNYIQRIRNAPTVTFDAGGGATATAVTSGAATVTAINLTNGGNGYLSTPRVIFDAPPAGGTTATATATVANGIVTGLKLVSGGSGYTSSPNIQITEGDGASVQFNSFGYTATNGGVGGVAMTNPGAAYASVPNVVFYADGAVSGNGVFDIGEQLTAANFATGVNTNGLVSLGTNFPTGTAVWGGLGNGTVSSVTITNAGGGLEFVPSVAITSGVGATATVDVTLGVITAVTITNQGLYYTDNPTIDLSALGPNTTAGKLTPTITGGKLTALAITTAGTGYFGGATVTGTVISISAIGGNASGNVISQGWGVGSVQNITPGNKENDGIYYSTTPSIVVAPPQYAGPGSKTAVLAAVLGTDGRLVGVNITDPGAGYTNAPNIQVVTGSGATATTTFANVGISAININQPGQGYIVAPQIVIVDGSGHGTGATAVANLTNGTVTSVNVTAPGSGYINQGSLYVIFLDPGTGYDGNGATQTYSNPALANVFVSAGAVANVDVYQVGSNYPAGTRLIIQSGKGSGFTATPVIAAGQVTSVTVTTGGSGYVGDNYFTGIGSWIATYKPNSSTTGDHQPLPFWPMTNNPTNTTPGYYQFTATSGVTRVIDIQYGTGENEN